MAITAEQLPDPPPGIDGRKSSHVTVPERT